MSAYAQHTDAQLVAGVLAGDREAFAAVYDRYADRLHDFCWSVLRDPHDAADAVQDTFVLVAQRLGQLNDPDRLRPWLYAVARSVALRRTRARKRVVLDEVGDMADIDPGPHRAAEQAALRDLVWHAAAGLSERDRALLDLHLRQGLDGAELGEAMGVSASHAYVLLTRLRDQVERSLGALLIARVGRKDCTELDAVLAGWDGRFSPLMRKRVARHVDGCAVCDSRRKVMVSPWALLAAVPLVPAPLLLREQVLQRVELVAFRTAPAADRVPAGAVNPAVVLPAVIGAPPKNRARFMAVAGVIIVVLLVIGVGGAFGFRGDPVAGEPMPGEFPTTTRSGPSSTSERGEASILPPSVATETVPVGPTTTSRTTPRRTTTTTTTPPVEPPPPPPPRDTTPPVISDVQAGAPTIYVRGDTCPRSTSVSAVVTDNVAVASVVFRWVGSDGTSGSRSMTFRSGRWYGGTVGPYLKPGTATWTIEATDSSGNVSRRSGKTAVEVSCPVP